MYECKRCGYSTSHKGHFKEHLTKVLLCPPKVEDIPRMTVDEIESNSKKKFGCECCSKRFSTKTQLQHHINIINELKKLNKPVIILREFGKENLEHITYDLIKSCITFGKYCINKVIDDIYFNKEHPENFNIRIRNIQFKLVEIYTSEGWKVDSMEKCIDRMMSTAKYCIMNKWMRIDLEELEKSYRYNSLNYDYYINEKESEEGYIELSNLFNSMLKPVQMHIKAKLINSNRK